MSLQYCPKCYFRDGWDGDECSYCDQEQRLDDGDIILALNMLIHRPDLLQKETERRGVR